ncbi:MAG: 30S ribosomal protein S3 [Dehalococcoidia bacterium]|nr:30S ribosomal protein S3 [Dehalococcoidia bacterium]
MGRKVHPFGFRLGVIRNWQAKWYADKNYIDFLQEDLQLRKAIDAGYAEAGISLVEIERQANKVAITIHTARPGVVIGRGGQRVDEMRAQLEALIGKRIQLSILEVQQPELDAYLVAKAVAEQIEHRVAFRRAMKQAMFRTMQAGAKGMRISCSGRLGGAEIARREVMHQGQVPLHTLRADIDYGFTEARTTLGRIGVKAWVYRGDILPETTTRPEAEEAPEAAAEAAAKPPVAPPKKAKAEAKAEAVAEEKPEAKAEAVAKEKPEVKAEAVAKEKPKPKAKAKAKAVAEEKPEVKAEAVAEEKPKKPKKKAAKPKKTPEAEKKAAKPKKTPEAEKKAEKPAEKAPKAEKKTTKRKTKKTTGEKAPVAEDKEEKDATAQEGEVPQES